MEKEAPSGEKSGTVQVKNDNQYADFTTDVISTVEVNTTDDVICVEETTTTSDLLSPAASNSHSPQSKPNTDTACIYLFIIKCITLDS